MNALESIAASLRELTRNAAIPADLVTNHPDVIDRIKYVTIGVHSAEEANRRLGTRPGGRATSRDQKQGLYDLRRSALLDA